MLATTEQQAFALLRRMRSAANECNRVIEPTDAQRARIVELLDAIDASGIGGIDDRMLATLAEPGTFDTESQALADACEPARNLLGVLDDVWLQHGEYM